MSRFEDTNHLLDTSALVCLDKHTLRTILQPNICYLYRYNKKEDPHDFFFPRLQSTRPLFLSLSNTGICKY